MNDNEIELCVKIIMEVLQAIKSECEGNCNSCLLRKECCLLQGIPSQWDLNSIEEQIQQIIGIERKIKRRNKYDYSEV